MLENNPLVTIAIPTYNRADTYLPQALQSALSQTYPNIDIVVSDNCSTDNTRALINKFNDARLRYFRHAPSIGQKGNYNFCVEQAKGDYLLLLHDDDAIDEDFVSSCIEAVQGTTDAGIIITGVRLVDADGKIVAERKNQAVGLPVEGFFRVWFSGKAPIYCCNVLFNTQKLREIGGFKSKRFSYADTIAAVRLAAQHPRIDVPEVKASFRIHAGAGYATKIADWCDDSLELLQLMCDLVPDESRHQILKEGRRFFSKVNYNRTCTAKSPWGRLVAIVKVMRYFNYRQFPSLNVVLHVFYGTYLYNWLRFIKRHAIRSFQPLATD